MKVLYITTAFPRYDGDVISPWLVETIKRLKERGIETEVFTSSYKGLRDQKICSIDVKRFRYFFKKWENLTHEETTPDRLKRGIFYKILVLFYVIGGIIGIVRLCAREKYDIIHVHWPFPHAIFGYPGKKICKAKLVSSFHGVGLRWVKSRMPIFIPFLKWVIRRSDSVTANSTYTAREIEDLVKTDVTVIPFGVMVREKKNHIESHNGKNVLFVGRLVERKGVRYLIEAFAEVSEKIDATLTIVGDGPERERLEKLVRLKGLEDQVIFTGKIPQGKLEESYENCSLFVLPACVDSKGDTEGLGMVLLEAMSHKKPVIASNVGGIVDIVRDGVTGFLVPEKDPFKLAEAILRVLSDKATASKLGNKGCEFVKANFSWERIITELSRLYDKPIQ